MIILYLFISIFILYILYVQLNLIMKRNNVLKEFKKIEKLLTIKYTIIDNIINDNFQNNQHLQSLCEYIQSLKNRIINIERNPDNIDQIFALDWDLNNKTNELIINIKKNNPSKYIDEYESLQKKFDKNKAIYNSNAKKLRHLTDVFPSSFLARLSRIKYINCIK